MQWADYLLGQVPVVNWFAPAIPLVYNTIQPLVQGGVYAFADLIGFNFAAVGPDIWTGFTTAVDNAIQGVLNWANIPLPPQPPLAAAAITARTATPLAAAARAETDAERVADTPTAPTATGADEIAGDDAGELAGSTARDTTGAIAAGSGATATDGAPAAPQSRPETPGQLTEAVSAAREPAQPARSTRRGHSAPGAGEATAAGTASSAKVDRPHRVSRSRG